jgi:2'-5' RNA ligase
VSDRLFFALWPDAALREELERRVPALLAGTEGRPQRPDQWHVTLEFIGSVAQERQPALDAAAADVVAPPVAIDFDSVEHWRKPQVLCLAARAAPAELGHLVHALRGALAREGFTPEARDYRPHVTLARKVRAARPWTLPAPIRWPADRFALVRSVTDPAGSRYEPLRWWNLRDRSG